MMMLLSRLSRKLGLVFDAVSMALMLLTMFSSQASSVKPDYTGHYALPDPKAGRTFELEVKQNRSEADVSFSAAMADVSSAAPRGSGKGRVEDGVLSFGFKDSFSNEGTCTLKPAKHGYVLTMTVTKVADSRPFHFYGTVQLTKVSN